uniref:carbonic anhydrase n=1 Tax=Corethron hystrix TaxID=216773 RepID=A0A7S1BI58_9STRA|mmetsp:Transcript_26383/g.60787  ORF Transcript_26383/g.60787 Transcript_26383/m.60787 type:complete len:433 (+) Transcript_26383:59-1357(+)
MSLSTLLLGRIKKCDRTPLPFVIFLLAAFLPLIPSRISAYELADYPPFSYDPNEPYGPPNWHKLSFSKEKASSYGPIWGKYLGWRHVDLKLSKNKCKSLRRPSPVNIIPNIKCGATHEILTKKIKEGDCGFSDLTFIPTPHGLIAQFPHRDDREGGGCKRPQIDVPDGWPNYWIMIFMEFHVRSEHLIDGRRYDGEIIMYHQGQFSQKREVTTVSVLLDASADEINPKFQAYLDAFTEVVERIQYNCDNGIENILPDKNWRTDMKHMSDQFLEEDDLIRKRRRALKENIAEDDEYEARYNSTAAQIRVNRYLEEQRRLSNSKVPRAIRAKSFPYDIWPTIYWYRYKGQLTVPPCTEMVLWHVLDTPLRISRYQFKTLARLIANYVDPKTCKKVEMTHKGENVRPLGKINYENQNVTHCTKRDYSNWLYKTAP